MQRDMQSESGNQQAPSVAAATDTRGKHRISAELKRLEQEIRSLEQATKVAYFVKRVPLYVWMQSTEWNGGLGFERKPDMGNDELCIKLVLEELEQLEKIEKASAACKNADYCGYKTRPITSKQLAQQTLPGIGGLKDPKIRRVADAGYCDRCSIVRFDFH
ncbi:unnamed protein product [Camellia sinensis]